MTVLSLLALTSEQDAAVRCDANAIVTAGAGAGKTRTLVARYLALLESGAPIRSLIAITFTDKAAREMRTRIREKINAWLTHDSNSQRELWQSAFAELDAARIGTIHSLCAAVLRAHPAEASIDPDFAVLDENASAALRAQAVETALAWTADDAGAATLFALLKENALRELLTALHAKRLDAQAAFDAAQNPLAVWQAALAEAVAGYVDAPTALDALATLRALRDRGELARDAGDKLAAQVAALLERLTRIESTRTANNWDAALTELFALRRVHLGGSAGKAGAAKEAVKTLRETYDELIDPWLGGRNAQDALPRWSLDERAAAALPSLRRAFDETRRAYDALKAERRALDFDDLEARTVALLEGNASVRAQWQTQTRAVLVDEFQDTNDRQRRIVYALSGMMPSTSRAARLFLVGDGKQSIYRFRGGDVTVLRRAQNDLAANSGAAFNLDLTYRAHAALVAQLNALLEPILGAANDPARPFAIPFAPLRAYRGEPRPETRAPFVEFCLGVGEDAAAGRAAAAAALAARLSQMRAAGEIEWGRIALLFRASTHFADYEAALERANIPFVTVAGKGFYARPEVRDLLNALAAIVDPTDDLALAGALRSPAFGLSDGALYLLRRGEHGARAFWSALRGDLAELAPADAARARRAREILSETMRLADRVSAAATLKYFLDATDYRAILRAAPDGDRPRRNVDKLLSDAHASGLVSLREFLEYTQTLRDVEAREGEAPVEAGAAVQLMTVHRAKGLEFDLVVIADAAHAPRGASSFWTDAQLGPVFAVAEDDAHSVTDRLAARRDAEQGDAEDRRLLYVAATRAKEKLIVSGHLKRKKDGAPLLEGWLEHLGAVVGLDAAILPETSTEPLELKLASELVRCTVSWKLEDGNWKLEDRDWKLEVGTEETSRPISSLQPLTARLVAPPGDVTDDKTRARQTEPPPRVWRVVPTAQRPTGPAWVVGTLTHAALRRWRFPDSPDFEMFLHPHALTAGLTDPIEIKDTVAHVQRLLTRFQTHPLFAEIDAAAERFHELPFSFERDGRAQIGVIDVLYRVGAAWRLVDFKTDEIRDKDALRVKVEEYRKQVARYADAVRALMDVSPATSLCFLDVRGAVRVVAPTDSA